MHYWRSHSQKRKTCGALSRAVDGNGKLDSEKASAIRGMGAAPLHHLSASMFYFEKAIVWFCFVASLERFHTSIRFSRFQSERFHSICV